MLRKLRAVIQQAAPGAEEKISYDMPGFFLNGGLVWFGAFRQHIGFYPKASGIAAFKKELAPYLHEKATLRFPLAQPIPYALIRKIVKFRVQENLKQ